MSCSEFQECGVSLADTQSRVFCQTLKTFAQIDLNFKMVTNLELWSHIV
jgi:hypothetical protein